MPRTAAIAALLPFAALAGAQTHHVDPPQKVTRAVAVYEWTGDLSKPTAARLVPVSLFINGHFEDAGLYLAHPVPFALAPGNVYSVEEAGQEKGTLDIEHARDFTTGRNLADQDPIGAWYGFGRFSPLAPPKPLPALHASAHPPVIVSSSDPDRPKLVSKTADTPSAKPADKAPDASSGTTSDTSTAKTPMGDDPDRPTLGRRTDTTSDSPTSKDSTGQTTSGSPTPPAADNDPERPSLRKRSPENTGRRSPPQSGVTGPDRPLSDDPDRPVIRHGKTPAQQDAAELKSLSADMHQVAAVSDPARRDPHLFAREWDSPAERADVLTHLQQIARTQAATYIALYHLTPGVPPAAPATPTPAPASSTDTTSTKDTNAPTLRRTPNGIHTTPAPATAPTGSTTKSPSKSTAKSKSGTKPAPAAPLTLTAEQLTGYTLTYGGLPTFVYTAEVPVTSGGPVYITLLAQRLPSGELQLSLHSLTDATHLDRTPWMRPIDAVDPDASHRADLLFELRAQTSRQFALYRLIGAQAEQHFLSEPIE